MRRLSSLMLFLLVLLSVAVTGQAAVPDMQVSPLDTADESLMVMRTLGSSGIRMMMPVTMYTETAVDEADVTVMLAVDSTRDDLMFGYFAFRAEAYEDADLAAMDEDAVRAMLGYVTDLPQAASYAIEEAFAPGIDVLRVMEDRATEGEAMHLVSMQGPWMLVLTALSTDAGSLPADAQAVQESLYRMALPGNGIPEAVYALAIPGTGLLLALPETMPLLLNTETATAYAGSIMDPADPDLTYFSLQASESYLFEGRTMATIDDDTKAMIVSRMSVGDAPEVTIQEAFAGGIGLMTIDEGSLVNLLTMQDGWLVSLTFMERDGASREEALPLAQAMLEGMLLGSETPVSVPAAG